MNNRDYWIKRALMQEQKTKEKSEKFLNDLQKQYNTAFMEIETDIQNWYKKYAKENNISVLEAKKILSEKETKDYILDIETSIAMIKDEDLKLYLRKKYFQERITRLQSLKNQTAMELEILRQSQDISTFEHLKNVYMDNLTVDSAITVSSAFHRFSRVAVENAVLTNWSGDTFSNRIWKHSNKLIDECQNVITTGIIQGHSIDTMTKKLSKRMDSNFANAKRIVRTESNYILSRATFENYETMGVEQYEFLATLDYKTSEICRELDKKVFYVKDKQVGVNCNPMHPNCRSTTIPYFSDMQGSRAARGVDGKTYSVDRNMSYRDWYNSLSEEEKKQMEILAKMDKNKSLDKEQYKKYKLIYGKEIGNNLEEFQKMKYSDNEKWVKYKQERQSKLNSLDYRDEFFGQFGDKEVRLWYKNHDENIISLIDKTKSVEEQARQAHSLRNKYRTEARNMMSNREEASDLESRKPNKTFDELLDYKISVKKLPLEKAYQDIIDTAGKTNKEVNKRFNLE
ncbi:MAG: minor capsid protein [Peptoanaerobacter stomatis]|uniref:minor capsid protein n=1 Tax=Peptoanaerobacter stomatis TaxID=796937 RepID=UPI003FA14C79